MMDKNQNSGQKSRDRGPVSTSSQYRHCILDNPYASRPHSRLKEHQSVSYLAHAVVCELDVSLVVQENVVQLQVSVNDALFMQEVQSDTDFSSIKSVKEKRKMQGMKSCPLVPPSGQRITPESDTSPLMVAHVVLVSYDHHTHRGH